MRYLAIVAVVIASLAASRLEAQYTRRLPTRATTNSGPYTGPAVTFNGTLKSIDKKQLIVDLDKQDADSEAQTFTFRISRKTKFTKGDKEIKPQELAAGTHVSLDALRDGDQKFSAVNVIVTVH